MTWVIQVLRDGYGVDADMAVKAYGLALFTRFGGFSHEDAKLLCELGKLDVRNRSIHSYIMKYNVYARKPLPEKK